MIRSQTALLILKASKVRRRVTERKDGEKVEAQATVEVKLKRR